MEAVEKKDSITPLESRYFRRPTVVQIILNYRVRILIYDQVDVASRSITWTQLINIVEVWNGLGIWAGAMSESSLPSLRRKLVTTRWDTLQERIIHVIRAAYIGTTN